MASVVGLILVSFGIVFALGVALVTVLGTVERLFAWLAPRLPRRRWPQR